MSTIRARALIVSTFIAGLFLQLFGLTLTYLRGEISAKDIGILTAKLLGIYSVQLAVILGGIFGQHKLPPRIASGLPFWIAFVLSVIWNLLLAWRTAAFYFAQNDQATDLVSYLDIVSGASSFLVVGSLAYFFAKQDPKAS
jgi:hypothetical protein